MGDVRRQLRAARGEDRDRGRERRGGRGRIGPPVEVLSDLAVPVVSVAAGVLLGPVDEIEVGPDDPVEGEQRGLALVAGEPQGLAVHAQAGDLAAEAGERGLMATDLMIELRRVINP